MTDQEKLEFERMKVELDNLRRLITANGNTIVIKGTVQIDGRINADKVYTQRSGSYVELTT